MRCRCDEDAKKGKAKGWEWVMEPLVGALSGLATAIVGLSAMLWKVNQNGHQNNDTIQKILGLIEQEMVERRETRKEMMGSFKDIAESLGYLKGRRDSSGQ